VLVAVGEGVAVAVGVAVGISAVPKMRVKGAEANPPRLPTASMLYLPTEPLGTRNEADAVPVLEATMFRATVRELPGAVRNRSVTTSPAPKPRIVAVIF
jgi:hypothetical protein